MRPAHTLSCFVLSVGTAAALTAEAQAQTARPLATDPNRAGNFDFAHLIAGHFQAGMRGPLTATPSAQ